MPARRPSGLAGSCFPSCHVHVTVPTIALVVSHPIVVICSHTSPVSAYRNDSIRCRPWRHLSSGGCGKRLPQGLEHNVSADQDADPELGGLDAGPELGGLDADPTAPPTIYDVARAAGVSIASVSRVLNGQRNPRQ